MPDLLTFPEDVETALLRPLTDLELTYIDGLIAQASSLLRTRVPALDALIARYAADPTDLGAVSSDTVAAVLAGVVKKYLTNPGGLASETQTEGPFSKSTAYALRSEKERRGALEITDDDIKALFPNRKKLRAGTIRLRPALAPRPVGRYGSYPTARQAVGAVIDWNGEIPVGEFPVIPEPPA